MNANEITPKVNARLNRIRIVSRIVRILMLAMFIFSLWMLILEVKREVPMYFQLFADLSTGVPIYVHPLDLVGGLIRDLGASIILVIWFWKLARLFHFYERGLIFSSETVRCIKILGLLCAAQWMLGVIHHILFKYYLFPSMQSTLPPEVSRHMNEGAYRFHMGLFPYAIWGINFGLFLAGIVIVLIAWVMDEGRKIQEEQELTV